MLPQIRGKQTELAFMIEIAGNIFSILSQNLHIDPSLSLPRKLRSYV